MILTFWRYATVALLAMTACIVSLRGTLLYDDVRVARGLKQLESVTDLSSWIRQAAPLRLATVATDISIWGRDNLGLHATNLALHALAAMALLALLRRLFPKDATAQCAAGLFAVWPMVASAVGVVAHRNEIIGSALIFLALRAWLRPQRITGSWVAGGLCALLATLETRMALLAPFIMLSYELWLAPPARPERRRNNLFAVAIIAVALLAAQVAFRWWIDQHGFWVLESWETAPAWSDWLVRLLRDWPAGVVTSLRWLIVPEPFMIDHGLTPSPWFMMIGGWAIIIGLGVLIKQQASQRPALAFALTWLLAGAAVASLNVFRHRYGAIFEQELYLVVPGLCLLGGLSLAQLGALKQGAVWRWRPLALLAAVAVALVLWTNSRARTFHDDKVMLDATLAHEPRSGFAHLAMGRLFIDGGAGAAAEKELLLVVENGWGCYEAFGNLGETALARKDFVVAEQRYRQALAWNPKSFAARYHLGHSLLYQKKHAAAREIYQQLLAERPRFIELYEALAATYAQENRVYEANQVMEQAKRLVEESRRQREQAKGK